MELSSDTLAQWHRVHIGLRRVLAATSGEVTVSSDDLDYDARAFFVTAYHVRDYLEQADGVDQRKVADHIKSEPALQFARDIAIRAKHHTMTQKPMSPGGRSIGGRWTVSLTIGSDGRPVAAQLAWQISTEDGPVGGLAELAADVVTAWKRFGLPDGDTVPMSVTLHPYDGTGTPQMDIVLVVDADEPGE